MSLHAPQPQTAPPEVPPARHEALASPLIAPTRTTAAEFPPGVTWVQESTVVRPIRSAARTHADVAKRIVDVIGAVVGLVLFAPLMALLAIIVKLESRGPVIFAHPRLGLSGRCFRCFKFRTMHLEAEQQLRADPALFDEYQRHHYKLPAERDPRITSLGRFLRKTSMDELPQFWNVLRGEMSLVGPRPIVPEELRLYGDAAPLLLSIKPGMTGAWAVQGRSRIGYPERADIELAYVHSWTIPGDVAIMLRTVVEVCRRRGAF